MPDQMSYNGIDLIDNHGYVKLDALATVDWNKMKWLKYGPLEVEPPLLYTEPVVSEGMIALWRESGMQRMDRRRADAARRSEFRWHLTVIAVFALVVLFWALFGADWTNGLLVAED